MGRAMRRKDTGILGEKLARDFLRKRGYRILEANYRCPAGEVDLITRHKDFLVFVEVRTKRSRDFGTPEESITETKKGHLRAVAAHYQQSHHNLPQLWRIDVVAVELDRKGKPSRIELIENAVGEGSL
jgi:putative endonuclease